MKAILPAAGYATRMWPLTLDKPKSLVEIGEKAIMDYSVEKILRFKAIDKIFIVSNNKFYSQFLEWRRKYKDIDIEILNDGSNVESERLGTVRDVYFALDKGEVDDDFLIINPDNLFSFEFNDAYRYFLKRRNLIGLFKVSDKNEVRRRGSVRLDCNGKVLEFREKDESAEFSLCSVGIYFFDKNIKNSIGIYLEEGNSSDRFGDFIQWVYKKSDIYGYFFPPNERIFDMGSIDGYERARKLWLGT